MDALSSLTDNNSSLQDEMGDMEIGPDGQFLGQGGEVFRSMKINQDSKTPYSDATQVGQALFYFDFL